jgi:hypothetical protein
MRVATNLAVFFPFLDENSFPARLLGSIDLSLIWWIVSLPIGLGADQNGFLRSLDVS